MAWQCQNCNCDRDTTYFVKVTTKDLPARSHGSIVLAETGNPEPPRSVLSHSLFCTNGRWPMARPLECRVTPYDVLICSLSLYCQDPEENGLSFPAILCPREGTCTCGLPLHLYGRPRHCCNGSLHLPNRIRHSSHRHHDATRVKEWAFLYTVAHCKSDL